MNALAAEEVGRKSESFVLEHTRLASILWDEWMCSDRFARRPVYSLLADTVDTLASKPE